MGGDGWIFELCKYRCWYIQKGDVAPNKRTMKRQADDGCASTYVLPSFYSLIEEVW